MSDSSIINDPSFPLVLLAHLIHQKRFFQRAVRKLKVEDFSRPGERVYQLILAVIQNYDECAPAGMMSMELNSRIHGAPDAYSPSELIQLQQAVDYLYSEQAAINLFTFDYMMGQLQLFLNERRVMVKAVSLAKSNAMDLDARLAELSQSHSSTRLSSGLILDDFFKPDNVSISPLVRHDIGVDFVDQLLGGGKTPGEVYGVIGPFGMGKTTLSVQLFCEGAARKRHSLYVLYEQPFLGDISNRMYGYLGGIPRSRMAGQSMETLHIEDQARLREVLGRVHPYMHIADMVTDSKGGSGGPDAISSLLRDYEDKGTPIEIVYIDQYLPFIRSWMAATSQKEERLRTIMEGTVYTFMGLATKEKHNCSFFLLHQTSTDGASQKPTHRPIPTDSAECKSFPFWLNSFLQLGVQDLHRRQWIVSGKGRATTRKEYIVECDGENWRYVYTPDKFRVAGSQFIDAKENKDARKAETLNQVDTAQQPRPEQALYG